MLSMNDGPQSVIDVDNLSVTFNDQNASLEALADVSFHVNFNEFVCILGPSGSGKSTLLRVLAGLLKPSAGCVTFLPGAKDCRDPRISLVFQQANLMPWRTVIQNITLPLELSGTPAGEAAEKATEWISLIGLTGFENSWPRQLSGGMAQRVAIARSLIQDPDLMLLDEPFGSLDALTREKMGAELLQIWQARQSTVIMVTHSISEALLLSDRIIVLTSRPGTVCMDLAVALPRPRSDEVRFSPEFAQKARALKEAIG